MKPLNILALALASGLLLNASCSSSSNDTNADAGPAGGPFAGPTDTHCDGITPVVVDPATCSGDTSAGDTSAGGAADASGSTSAGGAADASGSTSAGGATDCNQTHDAMYGDTLFNSEGDDDDCKYHASWTSTPIRLSEPVTFTLTASTKTPDELTSQPLEALADGRIPLTRLDVYQPCDPNRRGPAQNASAKITETAAGVFTAGPIKFDQSGRWVVRFHLYEQCIDGDTSPHGHIAFFVDVPAVP
jgi:hypothetical protein